MGSRAIFATFISASMTLACGGTPDPPTEPTETTSLELTISTTGTDLDPDGYSVTLDGTRSVAVPANGILTIPDLAAGPHTLALEGLAFNCAVTGPGGITVTLERPEGGTIRFDVTCARLFDLAYNYNNLLGEMRLSDPGGATQRTLPDSGRVRAWLPDGSALTVMRGLNEIWLMNPNDGTERRLLPAEGGFRFNLEWAPDAHALLYEAGIASNTAKRELYRLTLDGLVNSPLARPGFLGICEGSWSPDSRRIVIKAPTPPDDQEPGLYVMNSDGTNPTFLAVGHGAAWSPSGTDIVYSEGLTFCQRFAPIDRGPLHLINPDGGNRRQLTFPPVGQSDEDASWSHDGTRLAFVRSGLPGVEAGTAIFVINADGTGEHLVANIPSPSGPVWSYDGQYLATGNLGAVYIVSQEGGPVTPLPAGVDGACCAVWRP